MRALKRCCALLLWVHLVTFVQCNGCTLQSFKDGSHFHESFELSNLRQSYSSGDTVRVPCKMGYRGFFKITCSEGQWVPHGQRCEAISCGHPGDAQFADFKLVKGSDYTFGSQVLYTCQKGYQMTSFKSTRNCMQGGWDGHLPECEAIKCAPISVQDNVQVNGDIYEPTFGNVLQFSCKERSEVLLGEMELFCDENGKWNNEPPTCKEISCEKPLINNGNAQGDKQQFKEKEVLIYSCHLGYKKVDGRPSVCSKLGLTAQWIPRPECEPLTCKLKYNPPGTTTYDPQDQLVFRPGQTVRVSCGEKEWVKSTELRSAQIECQDTGLWDFPPECQLVTCFKHDEHVDQWEWSRNTIKMGDTLWYRCESDYDKTTDFRAVCTRQGWHPNPLCKAKDCARPSNRDAVITDSRLKERYDHDDTVRFQCSYDPDTSFTVTCHFGRWTVGQRCKEKPCTIQPVLDNAVMVDGWKQTYSNGDRVRFRCKDKTDIFTVTCHIGEWRTTSNCENLDCTTQPVMDNAEMVGIRSETYINGQRVDFRCSGERNTFRVTCQSGKWISSKQCEARGCARPSNRDAVITDSRLKERYDHADTVHFQCSYDPDTSFTVTCHFGRWTEGQRCEERSQQSQCGGPAIPNGFSYLVNSKLYYACSEGYKLQRAGWWNEATCVNGQWNNVECIAITDCGPIPAIPHMTETSEKSRFSEWDTIPISCESGYRNLHPELKSITCKKGKWDSNGVDFKKICTPIENKCNSPARVKNAVILAPFQKEYLSNTLLTYKCRDNYTIEGENTVRCINGTWEKTISCKALRCQAPLADQGLTVQGLPDDDNPILPDRFLTFSCEAPGTILNGSSTLICGKDGKWDKPFPTCMDTCDVLNVPDSVEGVNVLPTQLKKGQFLQFRCKNREHVLQGSADVTCLENRQWSHPFPTCRDPRGCGPAPLLENGDTLTFSNMEFAHKARVKYQCQSVYKMEGGPFKTCLNGEWTGEIKCLKPCTLDPTVMDPQNIEFKRKLSNKLYAPHNTGIDFVCKPGTTHDGRVEMRQICRDGQMLLPTCH